MPGATIAIDFDDTFTADRELWAAFIRHAQCRGHHVVCISARRNTLEHRQHVAEALPPGVRVLLAYDCPKREYALQHGLAVDIWIDDCPEAIGS